VFWDIEQAGGGCILDLGCHCVEISRTFIGKDIKPVGSHVLGGYPGQTIDRRPCIGLVKYENGAIGNSK